MQVEFGLLWAVAVKFSFILLVCCVFLFSLFLSSFLFFSISCFMKEFTSTFIEIEEEF